jgi:hypothetical protein
MRIAAVQGHSGLRGWFAAMRRNRPLLLNLLLLLTSLAATAFFAEIGLRLFFRQQLVVVDDERNLLYHYDPDLGWFPIPNQGKHLLASRMFTVVHNSQGFRDIEFSPRQEGGVVFLGDSFVWGYDVDVAERFTDKLRARHPEWPVCNLGVSGYGTDQEFLLLQKQFDQYKPRVVFLVFCVETDHDDNSTNVRYNGYYKPYFVLQDGRVRLDGVPVPQSEKVFLAEHNVMAASHLVRLLARGYFKLVQTPEVRIADPTVAILQGMHDYVRSKGAVFCVGLTRRDPAVEEVLQKRQIPWVDLSTSLRYPGFGNHWTPEGHSFVCERIEAFISPPKPPVAAPLPQ